jgi:flagellar biosynthesis component FlhA
MSLSDDPIETELPEAPLPATPDEYYYQELIGEGYRAIKGVILAVVAAELILVIGGVTGKPSWAFLLIGGLLITRHAWQIRQAREQLNTLANKD